MVNTVDTKLQDILNTIGDAVGQLDRLDMCSMSQYESTHLQIATTDLVAVRQRVKKLIELRENR
jgi:hypothetical protein